METIIIGVIIFLIIGTIGQWQQQRQVNKFESPMDINNPPIKNFASGNCILRLVSPGNNLIAVLKEVRTITDFGLREAKFVVDNTPSIVCKNIDERTATMYKQKLESVGAVVSVEVNDTNSTN